MDEGTGQSHKGLKGGGAEAEAMRTQNNLYLA